MHSPVHRWAFPQARSMRLSRRRAVELDEEAVRSEVQGGVRVERWQMRVPTGGAMEPLLESMRQEMPRRHQAHWRAMPLPQRQALGLPPEPVRECLHRRAGLSGRQVPLPRRYDLGLRLEEVLALHRRSYPACGQVCVSGRDCLESGEEAVRRSQAVPRRPGVGAWAVSVSLRQDMELAAEAMPEVPGQRHDPKWPLPVQAGILLEP